MYGVGRFRAFIHQQTVQKSQILLNSKNGLRFYSSRNSSKPQENIGSTVASDGFNNAYIDGRGGTDIAGSNRGSVNHLKKEGDEELLTSAGSKGDDVNHRRSSEVGDKKTETADWLEKVVYSSYLEKFMPPRGYKGRLRERFETRELEREEMVVKNAISLPISVKYLLDNEGTIDAEEKLKKSGGESSRFERMEADEDENEVKTSIQFPYKISRKMKFVEDGGSTNESDGSQSGRIEADKEALQSASVKIESVAERLRKQEIDPESVLDEPYTLSDVFEAAAKVCIADAGTPNPDIPPSDIPCGGCGALLHCQDQSIPGYISSEKFKKANKMDLMADVCYRCSVLEAQQATLNVNVSCEDYPKIVSKIREKFAMVLLIVDLTDFPCSIWPGILDIIGSRRPIILIGNKVDLLPQDSPEYLTRIEDSLLKCAVDVGMLEANIIHTALVSAKTGYGVERLITSIFNLCKGKGDIFIMGCTNVGKSSLFNTFLQSDLCKPQASDLVQRATISQWPGTTLNLLKFPMTNPTGLKKFLRDRRLGADMPTRRAAEHERRKLAKETGNPEDAVLTEHIGKTFASEQKQKAADAAVTTNDIFRVNPRTLTPPASVRHGQWNPEDPVFSMGHWVYDTPGAVNTNQILDLLTLPELMQSLPKTIIQPRSFFVKPKMSFFIGGLARLDYVEGPYPIRYTLFSNGMLPVTMCLIEDADMVYKKALGTKVFAVPSGEKERLSHFPPMVGKDVHMKGFGHMHSCGDIVLSSIGWVAVTVGTHQNVNLCVYTPNGKGIFIRQPALLPYAVNYKGKRVRGTYSYLPHSVYVSPRKYRRQQSQP